METMTPLFFEEKWHVGKGVEQNDKSVSLGHIGCCICELEKFSIGSVLRWASLVKVFKRDIDLKQSCLDDSKRQYLAVLCRVQ